MKQLPGVLFLIASAAFFIAAALRDPPAAFITLGIAFAIIGAIFVRQASMPKK